MKATEQKYMFAEMPGSDLLTIYGDQVDKIPPRDHAFRVVSCAHEIGHAIFSQYISGSYRSGFSDKEYNNLTRALTEGYALAVEYEVGSKVYNSTRNQGNKIFKEDAKSRLRFLKNKNTPNNWEISYEEGAKLANQLKRNGWKLDTSPELLSEVRKIVNNKVQEILAEQLKDNTKRPDIYNGIVIDLRPQSLYFELINEIKEIKPL